MAWEPSHLPGDKWANSLSFTAAHPGLFAGNSSSDSAVEFDYFRHTDNEIFPHQPSPTPLKGDDDIDDVGANSRHRPAPAVAAVLDIGVGGPVAPVLSPNRLFGSFFEDFLHAGDGGVYAELLSNRALALPLSNASSFR